MVDRKRASELRLLSHSSLPWAVLYFIFYNKPTGEYFPEFCELF